MTQEFIPDYVTDVNELDPWKKLMIYMHYICHAVLPLKHESIMVKKDKWFQKNWGHAEVLDETKTYAFIKPLHVSVPSYKWFVSEDRFFLEDMGENWQERGRATRFHVYSNGIYWWYMLHQDLFKRL